MRLAAIFILLACLRTSAADNWYVDKSVIGTSANTGESWTDAWTNFSSIVWGGAGVVGGDTLIISGGASGQSYAEAISPTVSGVGSPITIDIGRESGHVGKVTIQALNLGPRTNFTIRGAFDLGYTNPTKVTELRAMTNNIGLVIDGQNAALAGIFSTKFHGINISYVEIRNVATNTDQNGIGISISYTSAGKQVGNSIRYCWIHRTGGDGIQSIGGDDAGGIGTEVSFCILEWVGDNGFEGGNGWSFHDNIWGPSRWLQGHPDGWQTVGSYFEIYNNIVYDFGSAMIRVQATDALHRDIKVYNNLLFTGAFGQDGPVGANGVGELGNTAIEMAQYPDGIGEIAQQVWTNIVVANNTFYSTNSPMTGTWLGWFKRGEEQANAFVHNIVLTNCLEANNLLYVRNPQVQALSGAGFGWQAFKSTATYEFSLTNQPANAQTMTLRSNATLRVVTWVNSITDAETQVLIGANTLESVTNLYNYLTNRPVGPPAVLPLTWVDTNSLRYTIDHLTTGYVDPILTNTPPLGWFRLDADWGWGDTVTYSTAADTICDFNTVAGTYPGVRSIAHWGTNYSDGVAMAATTIFDNNTSNAPVFLSEGVSFELSPSDTTSLNLGTNLSHLFSYDILNRPRGSLWSRGAYESDAGLVLHYSFEDDTPGGNATDVSGSGNTGTRFELAGYVNGYPSNRPVASIAGLLHRPNATGNAAEFLWRTNDGVYNPDYGRVGGYWAATNMYATLSNVSELSVCVWAQYNSLALTDLDPSHPDYGYAVGSYEVLMVGGGIANATAGSWYLGRYNNQIHLNQTRLAIHTNAGAFTGSWGSLGDPAFGNSGRVVFNYGDKGSQNSLGKTTNLAHYGFVFSSGVVKSYYNGQFLGTNDMSAAITTLRLGSGVGRPYDVVAIGANPHLGTPEIGDDEFPNQGFLNGVIDEPMIFLRALTLQELIDIANAQGAEFPDADDEEGGGAEPGPPAVGRTGKIRGIRLR